jgi:hypothetical protein
LHPWYGKVILKENKKGTFNILWMFCMWPTKCAIIRRRRESGEIRSMRIKIKNSMSGSIPSEEVVEIPTVSGSEEVVVHKSQVTAGSVEVGFIGTKEADGSVLIELPRESVSGRWRVWVPKSAVT